ncbi:hypothetical protein HFO86_34660 [Rhizobium leguminosarum]|nr:hypothetical protein [Rhizobium leguminosarum]
MAAYDSRLYFGLRGPTIVGPTALKSGAIADVFETGTTPPL